MGLYIQATYEGTDYILYPSEDQPVLLDISSIDNGEIGELLGDLSQDFQIPATEEHNRFFQHAFNVGHQDIPGVYNSVEVSLNNAEQTLFLGSMVLKEWDKAEGIYTCVVESSIINLKDRLEGKELGTAPGWDAYDHSYDIQEWVTTNTVQEAGFASLDYFYPFVDYGYDDDGRARFESNEEIQSGQRPTQTSYVYQSTTTPGQAGDLYGDTFTAVDRNALYYPNDAGDLEAAERIVTSSPWFGEVSTSNQPIQGFISHPSTPLRIEQLKPAIKLKTCLDMVFELANLDDDLNPLPGIPLTYEAPFLSQQEDVFVLPNLDGKEGIITDTGNVDDGFILSQVNVSGENINKGSTAATNTTDELQFTFGDAAVTPSFGKANNIDGGAYVVPNPGTYELEFSGEFEVTNEDFNGAQFATHQVVFQVNGQIVERHQLDTIHRTNRVTRTWEFTYTANLRVGDRVTVALITNKHKGPNRVVTATLRDWVFRSNQVAKDWSQSTVKLGRQFVDTDALDFLKGVVQKQNLVIYRDKTRRNHYIIRQYNDWILGGSLIEWSDRVGPLVQSNLLLEQPKKLLFADAESDDRFNKIAIDSALGLTYGAREYESLDTGITDSDTDIGDFFTPLINGTITRASDFERYSRPNPLGIPQLYEFEDGEKKIVDTGIHIGYSRCTSAPGKFYYADGTISVAYNGAVRTISNFNEMVDRNTNWDGDSYASFGGAAYDLYWSQYIDHLYTNNNVKVATTVLLSPTEYQTLNINDTVHIDGNDYLINKISGFNLTEPAEVEVELISYKNNFTNIYEDPTIRYVDPTDPDIRTAIVGIKVIGLNDVDGSLVPFDFPVLQQDMTQIRLEGEAGTSVTETLNIRRVEGYDLSASNFNGVNVPTGVSFVATDDGVGGVDFAITVVIQSVHTFDYLEIRGEVDPIVAGDQFINLGTTSNTTGLVVQNPNIRQFGPVGSMSTFRVFLSVTDQTKQVDVSTIQVPNVTNVTLVAVADFGTGAELVFTALIEETEAASTYAVSVTGTIEDIDPGADTIKHTVNFAELSGYLNVSIYPTSITYTGEIGETHDFVLQVAPASGYRTTAEGVWSINDIAGIVNDTGTFQDGYGVGITMTLTTPDTIQSASNATVNGASAFLIGAETFTNTITLATPGNTWSYQGFSEQSNDLEVVIENVPKAKGIFQLDVTPNELYTFLDPTTLGFTTGGDGLTYVGASVVGGSIIANFEYTIGEENEESSIFHNESEAVAEDNTIKFIFNNIGLDGATIDRGEINVGYTGDDGFAIVDPTTSNNYIITVSPKAGAFTSIGQVSVSINNTSETLLIPDSDPAAYVEYEPTNERIEGGNFLFDLTGNFPTFGGNHVVTFDIGGTPGLSEANMGAFSTHLFTLPFGVPTIPSVSFTANGNVQFVASGSSGTVTSVTGGWLPSPNHMDTNINEGGGRVYAAFPLQARQGRSAYWLMFGGDGRTNAEILDYIEIREEAETSNEDVKGFVTTGVDFNGNQFGGTFIYTDSTGAQRANFIPAGEMDTQCVLDGVAGVTINQAGTGGNPATATANSGWSCPIGTASTAGTYADNSGSTNGMTFHFVPNGGTPTTIPMGNIYFEYE